MAMVYTQQVLNFVKLEELYYAGSHGMDIKGPTTVSNHKAKVSLVSHHLFLTFSLVFCLDLFSLSMVCPFLHDITCEKDFSLVMICTLFFVLNSLMI
jgi:hypothetical protein